MKSQQVFAGSKVEQSREEMAEAIRAWHRGESLTEKQLDLVDEARRDCLARAYGVSL